MTTDAFHGPRVTGPHSSEIDGACTCCRRYDTPDGTAPHEVFDVRAWATTRLCRPCLDDLAREILAALDGAPVVGAEYRERDSGWRYRVVRVGPVMGGDGVSLVGVGHLHETTVALDGFGDGWERVTS